MLAIRLKRVGRTNDPSFRIIVQDHRRSPKKTRLKGCPVAQIAMLVNTYHVGKGEKHLLDQKVHIEETAGLAHDLSGRVSLKEINLVLRHAKTEDETRFRDKAGVKDGKIQAEVVQFQIIL